MAMVLRLGQRAGQLAERLGHEASLQADVGVAHLAVELCPGGERRHRVDDQHVERARADEHVGDLEGLLARVGLGDQAGRRRSRRSPSRRRGPWRARRRCRRRCPRCAGPRRRRASPGSTSPRTRGRRSPRSAPGAGRRCRGRGRGTRAPVGIDSIAMWTVSPIRMIEPLPNCFSIWLSAVPEAFSRSSVICLSSPLVSRPVCRRRPYGRGVSAIDSSTVHPNTCS